MQVEVRLAGGRLSLDTVITLPCGAKVAVEADGRLHFFSNAPDMPTGECVLKWKMLDKAVEMGLLQGWVSVRDDTGAELEKVFEVVKRLQKNKSIVAP
jgi:hypothetical protein